MQNWEYLSLEIRLKVISFNAHKPQIYVNGNEVPDSNNMNMDDIARLMTYANELGAKGWEMVGCGNTGEYRHAIYFKRLKP